MLGVGLGVDHSVVQAAGLAGSRFGIECFTLLVGPRLLARTGPVHARTGLDSVQALDVAPGPAQLELEGALDGRDVPRAREMLRRRWRRRGRWGLVYTSDAGGA